MNPYIEDVLQELSRNFATELAPVVQPPYIAALLLYSSMILSAAGEEFDRAASRLREDNRALRKLFAEIRPLIAADPIASELDLLISSDDEDIRVSALRSANEAMRAITSKVHAIVEELDTEAGRAASKAIWRELSAATSRRRVSMEPF